MKYVCVLDHFSSVQLFETPWTKACQAHFMFYFFFSCLE